MTSVAVLVPFRDPDDGWRAPALRRVLDHLTAALPAADIVVCDAGGPMFNKSRSLNSAVPPDVDVLVMCDADTLIPAGQLKAGIRLAAAADGLVLPFDRMVYATRPATRRMHRVGLYPDPEGQTWQVCDEIPMGGGVNVLSRATWEQAGGWPEQFVGWGYEDVEFEQRCATVAPTRRLSGLVAHLWHPKDGVYYSHETVVANADRLREAWS